MSTDIFDKYGVSTTWLGNAVTLGVRHNLTPTGCLPKKTRDMLPVSYDTAMALAMTGHAGRPSMLAPPYVYAGTKAIKDSLAGTTMSALGLALYLANRSTGESLAAICGIQMNVDYLVRLLFGVFDTHDAYGNLLEEQPRLTPGDLTLAGIPSSVIRLLTETAMVEERCGVKLVRDDDVVSGRLEKAALIRSLGLYTIDTDVSTLTTAYTGLVKLMQEVLGKSEGHADHVVATMKEVSYFSAFVNDEAAVARLKETMLLHVCMLSRVWYNVNKIMEAMGVMVGQVQSATSLINGESEKYNNFSNTNKILEQEYPINPYSR